MKSARSRDLLRLGILFEEVSTDVLTHVFKTVYAMKIVTHN